MSNSALDRTTFEAIEAYVLDRMSADERWAFEQRMAADAALRAEVELEQENIRAVELGGVTRMLNEIGAEQGGEERAGRKWPQYLKYAAVVAVLLTAALWFKARPTTNERLFAEHFVADPGLPVTMSATNDHAFQDAMVAYKLGEYAEARAKWVPLQYQEPWNDTLRYYIAMSWLADGEAEAALTALEDLAHGPVSAFNAKAEWFLFLAYLKAGELEKAKSFSFEADPANAERARAIKAELER